MGEGSETKLCQACFMGAYNLRHMINVLLAFTQSAWKQVLPEDESVDVTRTHYQNMILTVSNGGERTRLWAGIC